MAYVRNIDCKDCDVYGIQQNIYKLKKIFFYLKNQMGQNSIRMNRPNDKEIDNHIDMHKTI